MLKLFNNIFKKDAKKDADNIEGDSPVVNDQIPVLKKKKSSFWKRSKKQQQQSTEEEERGGPPAKPEGSVDVKQNPAQENPLDLPRNNLRGEKDEDQEEEIVITTIVESSPDKQQQQQGEQKKDSKSPPSNAATSVSVQLTAKLVKKIDEATTKLSTATKAPVYMSPNKFSKASKTDEKKSSEKTKSSCPPPSRSTPAGPVWNSGIGYGTSGSSNWDINVHTTKIEQHLNELAKYFNELTAAIKPAFEQPQQQSVDPENEREKKQEKTNDDQVLIEEYDMDTITEALKSSCMIPVMLQYFESVSITDIEAHTDFYEAIFELCLVLSSNTKTTQLLVADHQRVKNNIIQHLMHINTITQKLLSIGNRKKSVAEDSKQSDKAVAPATATAAAATAPTAATAPAPAPTPATVPATATATAPATAPATVPALATPGSQPYAQPLPQYAQYAQSYAQPLPQYAPPPPASSSYMQAYPTYHQPAIQPYATPAPALAPAPVLTAVDAAGLPIPLAPPLDLEQEESKPAPPPQAPKPVPKIPEEERFEKLAKTIAKIVEPFQKSISTAGAAKTEEKSGKFSFFKSKPAFNEKEYIRILSACRVTEQDEVAKAPITIQGAPTLSSAGANRKMMKRISSELADLGESLPIARQSSVLMAYSSEDLRKLQMLVIAPEGTPYGLGCFLFQIVLPENYPVGIPKMGLLTTGGGTVRFNPNLYENGYVCLSLLGTWSGQGSEQWSSKTSTLLQLAVSIQSLVFVEHPYYNEPGYELRGQSAASTSYSKNIRLQTIRWAMCDMIANPPPAFKTAVHAHFFMQKDSILKAVEVWLKEDASLETEIAKLKTALNDLKMPSLDDLELQ